MLHLYFTVVLEFLNTKSKAIELGHSKINVNTECQIVWTAAVREKLATDDKVYDPRKVIGPGVDAIIKTVTEKIQEFGSNGKA